MLLTPVCWCIMRIRVLLIAVVLVQMFLQIMLIQATMLNGIMAGEQKTVNLLVKTEQENLVDGRNRKYGIN